MHPRYVLDTPRHPHHIARRHSPGGGAGRKMSQIFWCVTKLKPTLGSPLVSSMSLTRIYSVLLQPLSPHSILVWPTPAKTVLYFVPSLPSADSLTGWAQSCQPHCHACHAKWFYHRRAQLCATGRLGPNITLDPPLHNPKSVRPDVATYREFFYDMSRNVADFIIL